MRSLLEHLVKELRAWVLGALPSELEELKRRVGITEDVMDCYEGRFGDLKSRMDEFVGVETIPTHDE